ncbi:tetratricopeptide repeat protein [candidate division WOR-3 bacterium]|nr:tetratricopeptide repeat protein [candidate division WOR-3 bacterium]
MIRSRHIQPLACLLAVALLGAGCAYFNTFYNARASYREAMKLKDQGQNAQAKAKFDKAIEKSARVIQRWPKSRWVDDALFLIGVSYYEEAQYEKAIRGFDQLGLAFPNSEFIPRAQLYRGLSLLADKQYGTARVALDAVKQKYPRLADEATYNLARSFIDRKELARGVDSLATFLKRFPRSRFRVPAVKMLAEGAYTLERYVDAEKWYAEYAKLTEDPKQRALTRLKIAACRYELGKYDEAVVEVSDVLGRYADLDDEANLLLGKALMAMGRPADALAAWVKVRGPNAFGAEAAFLIGKYHEEGSDFERARAHYDTARTRRADSDHGILAVKRLSLLDALAARTSGKRAGGDSLQPAEAMFLIAEVNNLNLGEYDKAMELYQKVYDSFPDTDWAAKALFAKAWILRNVKDDTSGAEPLLRQEISEYPETEYADESRRWLGLPVPKRAKKKPEVAPERAATLPPPPAGGPEEAPRAQPGSTLPESPSGDTGDFVARQEPGRFPHGPREPGRLPERPELAGGPHSPREMPGTRPGVPEMDRELGKEMPTGAPPHRADVPPVHPNVPPEPPTPETVVEAQGDTVAAKPPATPSVDTTEHARPSVKLQLEIVHFATDSWQIQAADSARLKADAESLKARPDVKIVVVGYCDPRASEQYNERLGLKRAQAVRAFFVAAGIDAGRISVRSEGEKRPISTRPDEYWLDRRVEFEYE